MLNKLIMQNINYEIVELLSKNSFYNFLFGFLITITIFALVAWGFFVSFKLINLYLDCKRISNRNLRNILILLAVIIFLFIISFVIYYKNQLVFYEIKELERILEYKLL